MGCIFTNCNKKSDELSEVLITRDNLTPLIMTPHCFVCNKMFATHNEYNKHIPKCKLY